MLFLNMDKAAGEELNNNKKLSYGTVCLNDDNAVHSLVNKTKRKL